MADDETWSLTSGHRFHYDIFLSFRGEDTRHNFTNKLYHELVRNGVRTFIDDEGLDRGEEIAPSLFTAIEDSAASIAVISENYCSSKWCLEELAKITECKRLLLPVFYGVDPSDVRRQKGPFEEHFRNYDTLVEAEKVSRWREAMKKAGNTSGWDSRLWEEAELIQSLVKKVLGKLDNTPIGVAKYPVGLHSRLDELLRLLNVKANGVIVLGLYGMGGVGKTTLAKALYNQFVVHFKKRSFISDVKEIARRQNGLATLQSKLIGDLTSGASPDIDGTAKGIQLMKEYMNNEPVAIFLDDVDNADQLRVLVGGRDWFRQGSRVIITTRDKNVLLPSIVNENFEVKELSSSESLTLFSYHAFGREQPPKNFSVLAEEVVTLSGGLPLALEVFGSLLFYKKRMKEWQDVVQKLRQIRPGDLQNVLEISFEALDEQEKCIFLDLACLLLNTRLDREDAIAIFKGCGFGAESAIIELTAKSLLKIVDGNVLWMHDQLKDMGRQIVQRENFGDVGKRSRLWNRDDITDVLKNHKGTRKNEGIVLDFEKRQDQNSKEVSRIYLKKVLKRYIGQGRKENGVTFCTRAFQCMVKLRLLQINHVKLVGNFKLLPAELKWLQWKGCPLQVIPPELLSRKIAVLDLSESMITHVWKKKKWNCYQNKMAKQLKVMNLHSCRQLKEIPDLSGLQLEKLILEQCKELVKIHPSIGDLTTLTHLNMKDCQSILAFPDDVSGLKRLEVLILSGCSSLKELPEDLSGWKSLRELLLDGTAITKLPTSIFHLKKLQMLNLNDCRCLELLPRAIGNLSSLRELSFRGSALKELPDSIGNLKNLEELSLRMCKGLTSLPDSLGNLKSLIGLYLNNSSIKELPPSVGLLSHLKFLWVNNCKYLSELPNSMSSLSSLVWLCLEWTSVSELSFQLGNLKSLEKLEMGNCASIRSLPSSTGNMLCLTTLDLHNTSITELPDSIGLLERLWKLNLNNCLNLQQLPASIGSLKSLCYLYMAETAVSELPDEIGMLSNLKLLKMRKKPQPREDELLDMEDLHVGESSKRVTLPESFSNLSSLEVLDAHAWKFSGKISDDFQKLSALEKLDLGHNDFCSLPSSMKGLCVLKHLLISNCRKLKFLPELPSSLEWLNAANCSALERIASISNLEYLEQLQFSNCKKITDIPGLESLKSLVRLYTVGCNACLPSIKRRISKDSLRHIKYLCVPGSDIPDWFIQEVPNVSTRKHRDIKGVIIGVVLSLDQQVEDNFRHKVPAIVDIQATITTPGDAEPKLRKTLNLEGVPDTDEDQLYLCRFQEHSDFMFVLEEGDRVQVAIRESPRFNGLKLKKHGMHLVFENEDDFDDNDEDLFDESQQSVSKKLANFFNSL
ncbi:disease resistance protein RPV1-like [Lycium ferocissimum]|uniref:disease resistance protein RPV1-like n=1 Tax=Lycium ferocissimum TaxID=112874 RepID=UPI0028169D83|nr:disease resistance protein RPV1-like [Lycium ferocissimum]